MFFAALEAKKGEQADFRSSQSVDKGETLLMMPVPPGWNGEHIERSTLENSIKAFEAHVMRTEGRGQFKVRILSHDQQDLMARMRSGIAGDDHLKHTFEQVGAIQVIHLEGRIGTQSAAKLQSLYQQLPAGPKKPVLLDFTEVIHISKHSLGMLLTVFKDLHQQGFVSKALVRKDSVIEDLLTHSKVVNYIGVYHDREAAVEALLLSSIG